MRSRAGSSWLGARRGLGALTLYFAGICGLPGQSHSSNLRAPEPDAIHFEAENVDLVPLHQEARKRFRDLSEEELAQLVDANLRFILHNQLNQAHFLVTPDAQRVVDRMVRVLQLTEEIAALLQEGRSLAVQKAGASEQEALMRSAGQLARELGRSFGEYFLDLSAAPYQLRVPQGRDGEITFVHYLIQFDRISRLLTRRVEDYFFSSVPGSVQLSHFDESSVTVLSESLMRLSEIAERRMSR